MTSRWILLGLTSITASPAYAEVCDKERPLWSGEPASAWLEATHHLLSLPTVLLFAISVVAIALRSRIPLMLCAVLWGLLGWVSVIDGSNDPTGIYAAAVKEGCIGNPILFICLCAAICLLAFYLAFRPIGRASLGEA